MIPAADPQWAELLEDAAAIAEEYRENDWDAVVLEPAAVVPVEREERIGLDVRVSDEEYALVADLVEGGDVTISAADVYYRPPETDTEARIALAVERDEDTETAVFVPLCYDLEDETTRSVFETALATEELLVHVTTGSEPAAAGEAGSESESEPEADSDHEPEDWVTFSHDDPSLFLEEADVRNW